MRKGLSAFKLVPQRSKHHSVHKKPLSPKTLVIGCPKTIVTACPKKGGHDAYPLSHELQIQNWNSKTWTLCSRFVPSAPILKCELQLSTVSSNSQPWPPIINRELQFWTLSSTGATPKFTKPPNCIELSKTSCDNVQIDYSFFIIYYYILYVFYFYYILFYIICILFYYMLFYII